MASVGRWAARSSTRARLKPLRRPSFRVRKLWPLWPTGRRNTEKYWKAGKCDMIGGPHIRIWPQAHTLYGWDMLASVLVHEFGHLKLSKDVLVAGHRPS